MNIDFPAIENLFRQAEHETLLEHEVYAVLAALGIDGRSFPTPLHPPLPREK
jgi:hypothetical protein